MQEVPRGRGREGEKKVKGEKKRSKDGILTWESTAQDDGIINSFLYMQNRKILNTKLIRSVTHERKTNIQGSDPGGWIWNPFVAGN
jgi:hypothetical protein